MRTLLRSPRFYVGALCAGIAFLCYLFPVLLLLVWIPVLLWAAMVYYEREGRNHYLSEPDGLGNYVIYDHRGRFVSGPHTRSGAIRELYKLTSARNRDH